MSNTDKKAEPFRITGPGRYRDAGGGIATVTDHHDGGGPLSKWIGVDSAGDASAWSEDGTWLPGSPLSLVARVDEPAEEMAGLTGLFAVEFDQSGMWRCDDQTQANRLASEGRVVVDLSKVPAGAIVKPGPKVETRKVWLIFDKHGHCQAWDQKPESQNFSVQAWNKLAAIVEREITFTHGEGLGDEK